MEIRIRSTSAVLDETQFRQYVQETYQASYDQLTNDIISQFGADPVLESPMPVLARYQSCYRDGVQETDGKWYTKWTVVNQVSDEEKAQIDKSQADAIRTDRNRLLSLSDWTQMPDNNLAAKANWATYRQQLRDLPTQSGFPWDVTWPVEPK
jgi:Phage tail assembly chaperone protein